LRRHGFRIEKIDEPLWEAGERAAGIVSISEAAAHLQDADKSLMAPALAQRLRLGTTIDQVAMAHAAMAALRSSLLRQVAPGSVILTPTWPFRAPRIHQTSVVVRGKRLSMDPHRNIFVRAANAADAPALTLPAGFYPGHVPFGLQLMAPQGRDRELLATAASVAHAIAGDAAWCEA
jgi:aspartyl-tRNA(Asn)/glutamyl-tRNA(Gln) amidotransferase subunit A